MTNQHEYSKPFPRKGLTATMTAGFEPRILTQIVFFICWERGRRGNRQQIRKIYFMNISKNENIFIKKLQSVRKAFHTWSEQFSKRILLLTILLICACQYRSKMHLDGIVASQAIHPDGSRTLHVYAINSSEHPSSIEYKCDLEEDEIKKRFSLEALNHADYGSFEGIPENLQNDPFTIYEKGLFKLHDCEIFSLKDTNQNLCSRISSIGVEQYDCRREMKIKDSKKNKKKL